MRSSVGATTYESYRYLALWSVTTFGRTATWMFWLEFFQIQRELSMLLNRPVDLHTEASLSRMFLDQVLGEAQVQYAAP